MIESYVYIDNGRLGRIGSKEIGEKTLGSFGIDAVHDPEEILWDFWKEIVKLRMLDYLFS